MADLDPNSRKILKPNRGDGQEDRDTHSHTDLHLNSPGTTHPGKVLRVLRMTQTPKSCEIMSDAAAAVEVSAGPSVSAAAVLSVGGAGEQIRLRPADMIH